MMRLPELVSILTAASGAKGSAIEHTITAVREIGAAQHFEDDVSIVEVSF
jgi:hypothetical protein